MALPNPGEELSTLNFESMIGGPLMAVVKAQAQSAMASVNYIKAVGFKGDESKGEMEPVMVSFTYTRDAAGSDGTIRPQKFALNVPILTMLPIPFIRVEETTIDFNAKIVSTQFARTDTELNLGIDAEVKGSFGPVSASLKVNFSYQKKDSSGNDVQRTYSMNVHVRAVQDEMPPGTERLLSILENVIKESPGNPAPPA